MTPFLVPWSFGRRAYWVGDNHRLMGFFLCSRWKGPLLGTSAPKSAELKTFSGRKHQFLRWDSGNDGKQYHFGIHPLVLGLIFLTVGDSTPYSDGWFKVYTAGPVKYSVLAEFWFQVVAYAAWFRDHFTALLGQKLLQSGVCNGTRESCVRMPTAASPFLRSPSICGDVLQNPLLVDQSSEIPQ